MDQTPNPSENEFDLLDPGYVAPEPAAEDLNAAPAADDAQVPPVAPAAPAPVEEPTVPAQVAASGISDAEVRDAKIPGMKDSSPTSVEGKELETKRKLMSQPKVRMMIPLDPGEKPGAYRTVIINGYRFDVKKNVMVDLPEAVANLLSSAYSITSDVLDNNALNLSAASEEKRKALGA